MVKNKNKESNNENKVGKSKELKRPLNDVENNNIEKSKKSKKQSDLPVENKNNNDVNNKINWYVTLNTKNIDDIKQETIDPSENENNGSIEICDAVNYEENNLTNNSNNNDTTSKKNEKHLPDIKSDDSITLCVDETVNSPQKNSTNNSNINEITSKNCESDVNNDAKTINNDNIKNEESKTIPISNKFTSSSSSSDESTDKKDEKSLNKKLKIEKSTDTEDSSDQESDNYTLMSQSVQTEFSSDDSDNDENKNTFFIPEKIRSKSFGLGKSKIPEPAIADVSYSDDDDDLDEDNKVGELSKEDAMKLKKMQIKLAHKPPTQHCIEKHAGSTTLTPTEREEFNKYAKLKRGSFVSEEDDILKKNWQDFCSLNDWDENIVKPFLQLRHNYGYYISTVEERKKFLRFLGRELNNRSLYSIFRRFKVLYEKKKVARYSSQEDAFIIKCLKNSTKKNLCSMIASELKRSNQSVWRRIKVLQAKDDKLLKIKSNKSNEKKK